MLWLAAGDDLLTRQGLRNRQPHWAASCGPERKRDRTLGLETLFRRSFHLVHQYEGVVWRIGLHVRRRALGASPAQGSAVRALSDDPTRAEVRPRTPDLHSRSLAMSPAGRRQGGPRYRRGAIGEPRQDVATGNCHMLGTAEGPQTWHGRVPLHGRKCRHTRKSASHGPSGVKMIPSGHRVNLFGVMAKDKLRAGLALQGAKSIDGGKP